MDFPQEPGRFFVITGGPGTGKTTVLAELARRGYACVPEDARALIREQIESGGSAVPWADAPQYADLLLERSMQTYQALVIDSTNLPGPVFFDRGIGDAIAYAGMIEHSILSDILTQAQTLRYAEPVFLAPWWPEIYVTDQERRQSREEAARTEHVAAETYRRLGYRLVRLPLAAVEERAEFILAHVRPA